MLNKIDLKKSFSLLSPIFLLVSSEPISVRLLWTASHRISFDKFINDSHWYAVICCQAQSERTERVEEGWVRAVPDRNSLAKSGPDQWGFLNRGHQWKSPVTHRDGLVLLLLPGLVTARSSLSTTPEVGSGHSSNQGYSQTKPTRWIPKMRVLMATIPADTIPSWE